MLVELPGFGEFSFGLFDPVVGFFEGLLVLVQNACVEYHFELVVLELGLGQFTPQLVVFCQLLFLQGDRLGQLRDFFFEF